MRSWRWVGLNAGSVAGMAPDDAGLLENTTAEASSDLPFF
jgi:hypothetical protein